MTVGLFSLLFVGSVYITKASRNWFALKLVADVIFVSVLSWLLPLSAFVLIPYFVWKRVRDINRFCRNATGENLVVATTVAATRTKARATAQSQVVIASEKIEAISDLNNMVLPINVSKRSLKRIIEGAERRIVS